MFNIDSNQLNNLQLSKNLIFSLIDELSHPELATKSPKELVEDLRTERERYAHSLKESPIESEEFTLQLADVCLAEFPYQALETSPNFPEWLKRGPQSIPVNDHILSHIGGDLFAQAAELEGNFLFFFNTF